MDIFVVDEVCGSQDSTLGALSAFLLLINRFYRDIFLRVVALSDNFPRIRISWQHARMRKPRAPAKARQSEPAEPAEVGDPDVLDARRRAGLEKQYRESCAAFTSSETAQSRADLQLYRAIGRLAEFAAAVGNDHQVLTDFAAEKGVRTTKASSLYTVIAKLVVTTDRRKASKYAAVLHLAARQGIEPTAEAVVAFIQAEGGIEACLKRLRDQPRETGSPTRRGRPSAFNRAVARIASVGRSEAPEALQRTDLPQGYVLIVGVRGDDGTLRLLHEPVTDDGLVRKAVATLVPKAAKGVLS